MTVTTWSRDDALCITGTIPAIPASPTQADYDTNWGIMVGANATPDEPTGPIGRVFSSITLTFSGTPSKGLSAIFHLRGEPDGTVYCYDGIKSGQAIDVTRFNTSCWDGRGSSPTVADSAKIDRVGLRVWSGPTDITVSDLCITGIGLGSFSSTSTATATATATTTAVPTSKAALSLMPSAIDLGSVPVGATRAGQVVLHNSGAGAATSLMVFVTGTDFAIDAATTTCKTSLDAGATCVVGYFLAPKAAGDKAGQISAIATGTSAVAIVTATAPAPAALVISPTTAPLTANVGVDSAAFTFMVANSGGTATGNLTAAISGTDKDSFRIASMCTILEPRAYCTVSVVFNAATAGTKTAKLTVTDSMNSVSANLTGAATVPRTP